ncbi:hypothetical protein VT85_16825 [Planctomyces sp. SH-PL62]|nr:hypothetical protein VT85_16825 [Planctomyces sp. SH-PL62]
MNRRGLMGAFLALSVAAFAGFSAHASDSKAECACCKPACLCPVCACDANVKAGEPCDCCCQATCCADEKAGK